MTNKKVSVPTIVLLTIAIFITFALLLPIVTGIITNILSLVIAGAWVYLLFRIFLKGYSFGRKKG